MIKDGVRGRVTERDLEIVRWLGRHRLATAEQVRRRFGLQRAKVYRRLELLVTAGLVRYEPGVRSRRVYLARPAGLRAVGLDLPGATVSAASFAHDIAVLDVAIAFEAHPRWRVLTEREIRALDRDAAVHSRYALRARPHDGTPDPGRWPDLVLEDIATGTRHAVEIELTRKTRARVRQKLRDYYGSEYKRVIYLVPNRPLEAFLRGEISRMGVGDRIRVDPIDRVTGADPPIDAADAARDSLEQLRTANDALRRRVDVHQRHAEDHAQRLAAAEETYGAMVEAIRSYLAADRAQRVYTREAWRHWLAEHDATRRG
jgi:hypothetical protein